MKNRYFFDKRIVKKNFIKYGLIFLFLIPVLVVINAYLNQFMQYWTVVVIDFTISIVVVFAVNWVLKAIRNRKEEDVVAQKVENIKAKRKDLKDEKSNVNQNDNLNEENIKASKKDGLKVENTKAKRKDLKDEKSNVNQNDNLNEENIKASKKDGLKAESIKSKQEDGLKKENIKSNQKDNSQKEE